MSLRFSCAFTIRNGWVSGGLRFEPNSLLAIGADAGSGVILRFEPKRRSWRGGVEVPDYASNPMADLRSYRARFTDYASKPFAALRFEHMSPSFFRGEVEVAGYAVGNLGFL